MNARSVKILPTRGRYGAHDARWLDEKSELLMGLRDAVPSTQQLHEPVPGTKGIAGDILVPLISAGALTGVVEVLRTWLGRDDGRAIRVRFGDEGDVQEIELSGKALAGDTADLLETKLLSLIGKP